RDRGARGTVDGRHWRCSGDGRVGSLRSVAQALNTRSARSAPACYARFLARKTELTMGGALNGSVILRGVKIDLDTDIGNGFVIDCCRHIEDPTMITAEQLKAKYQLSEEAWRQLADNEPLQQAVARTKERRIRSGECAAERAQFLFLSAPSVLSTILHDSAASPRHRIEAARELRQTAAIGSEDATPAAERFSIRIDLTAA